MRAPPAVQERQHERRDDQREVRPAGDLARVAREQHPVLEPSPQRAAALDVARGAPRPGRARDRVDGESERDRPEEDDHRLVPGLERDEEREQDHAVEEEARVRRRAEQLRRAVDDQRTDHDAADAAESPEDDDGVDRDQQADVVVARERAGLDGAEDRSAEARGGGAEHEREQLQPVDRNAHRLGSQRILAQRAPRSACPGAVDEVEHDHQQRQRDQRVEVVLLRRRDLVAEEVERVDLVEPVRAPGQVDLARRRDRTSRSGRRSRC